LKLFFFFSLALMASGCGSITAATTDSHTVVSQYTQGRYERVEKTCHTLNHEMWHDYHCHIKTLVKEARK